jgi:hypothetical protein
VRSHQPIALNSAQQRIYFDPCMGGFMAGLLAGDFVLLRTIIASPAPGSPLAAAPPDARFRCSRRSGAYLRKLIFTICGDCWSVIIRATCSIRPMKVCDGRCAETGSENGYASSDTCRMRDLYNRADPLVLPLLEEGFGLPAFEAAACGTPVVTSNVGPAADLLGPAAWAFPPHDITALTDGLRDLLRDPARRRAMSEAGRQRSRSFSWDRVAARAHSIFREIGRL